VLLTRKQTVKSALRDDLLNRFGLTLTLQSTQRTYMQTPPPAGSNRPVHAPAYRNLGNQASQRFSQLGAACSARVRSFSSSVSGLASRFAVGLARALSCYKVSQTQTPSQSSQSSDVSTSSCLETPVQFHVTPKPLSDTGESKHQNLSSSTSSSPSPSPSPSPSTITITSPSPSTITSPSPSPVTKLDFSSIYLGTESKSLTRPHPIGDVRNAITNELASIGGPKADLKTFMRTGENRKQWCKFIAQQGGTCLKALHGKASGRPSSFFKRGIKPTPILEVMYKAPENIPDKLCMLLSQVKQSAQQAEFSPDRCMQLVKQSFVDIFCLAATPIITEGVDSPEDVRNIVQSVNTAKDAINGAKNTETFNVFLAQLLARGDRAISEAN
jgi:hypothetical protein